LELDSETLGLTGDYQDAGTFGAGDDADVIRAISELESRYYQGNMLLRDSDVMGMAHGLEIRVPFLDRRLLDRGHALPGEMRLPAGSAGKHLLRTAFADLLRPALTNRPKTGFTLPLAQWMLGPMHGLCERSLTACTELGGLPDDVVRCMWEKFTFAPSGSQGSRALALVVLGHFLQLIGVG
jgi:asparagine synthase (glutamine-hydrolysing)